MERSDMDGYPEKIAGIMRKRVWGPPMRYGCAMRLSASNTVSIRCRKPAGTAHYCIIRIIRLMPTDTGRGFM